MGRDVEDLNRRMLRARDLMDRAYAEPLDVRAVAAVAHVTQAHFSRCFRATFGETPHRYLQRRRVERAMFLLRETDRSVTDICLDVGCTSLGTFSRTFRQIVGETPSAYRAGNGPMVAPNCVQMAAMRPRDTAVAAVPPRDAVTAAQPRDAVATAHPRDAAAAVPPRDAVTAGRPRDVAPARPRGPGRTGPSRSDTTAPRDRAGSEKRRTPALGEHPVVSHSPHGSPG